MSDQQDYSKVLTEFHEALLNVVEIYTQAITKLASDLGIITKPEDLRRVKLFDVLYPRLMESAFKRIPIVDRVYGRFINYLTDKWPVRFLPKIDGIDD